MILFHKLFVPIPLSLIPLPCLVDVLKIKVTFGIIFVFVLFQRPKKKPLENFYKDDDDDLLEGESS